jgi:hypothetical protein
MTDETQDSTLPVATVDVTAAIEKATAMVAAMPSLSVRSINIVPDSHNKSPGGMSTDIVEIALFPAGEGNAEWMQWCDLARFRCERGAADKLLAMMGLSPKK